MHVKAVRQVRIGPQRALPAQFRDPQGMGQGNVVERIGAGPRHRAEVTIRDTGPGLSSEAEATLFTAFRTTKASGLGVGLALGRRIAERLGGQLDIRNRADGVSGVEARLILPLRS